MSNSHHNAHNWSLLFALTLIWGSSYILIKKGLVAFTPIELACLRISVSFLASLPLAIKALQTVPRSKLPTILQVGLFGSGIPAFLFALSMTRSGSAINGILNALSPLWTLIIGYYLYKVAISKQKVTGVVIGFLGALVLVLGRRGAGFQIDVVYSFLPILATLCYGISTNMMKQKLPTDNPVYTTSLAMMMIGIPALTGLCFTAAPQKILTGTIWLPTLYVVILSLFGTLVGWILFYRLVQRTDALFGASVTYLAPVVAVAWGLFDGEVLSVMQLLGMALILVGVYFTTTSTPTLQTAKK